MKRSSRSQQRQENAHSKPRAVGARRDANKGSYERIAGASLPARDKRGARLPTPPGLSTYG